MPPVLQDTTSITNGTNQIILLYIEPVFMIYGYELNMLIGIAIFTLGYIAKIGIKSWTCVMYGFYWPTADLSLQSHLKIHLGKMCKHKRS